jgi:hypothetical protein
MFVRNARVQPTMCFSDIGTVTTNEFSSSFKVLITVYALDGSEEKSMVVKR